jgi:hypothetical protein
MPPAHSRSRWRPWLALALLLVPAGGLTALPGRRLAPPHWPAGLLPGQSPAEVHERLGAPARISRQVVAHRAVEQWHYGPPRSLRLTFDCLRGQRPRLQSVHSLNRRAGR